jgi:GNAT superfamily N-acetyltransferase
MARGPVAQKHKATITYLEMGGPPTHTAPPPAIPHAVVRAHKPPVHFYRYLYDTVGQAYVWVERRRLGDAELRAIIEHEKVEIYVIHVDGVPAGFGELDFRRAGAANIAYFGLMPQFVGRGIGRYFLHQLLKIAWSHDISVLTVNTCTLDHPSALALYQKFGFRPVARRDTVIEAFDAARRGAGASPH